MFRVFSGGPAYFRRGLTLERVCVSEWIGLDNKTPLNTKITESNSLKQRALTACGLYSGGLIVVGLFVNNFFGAYFRGGIFSGRGAGGGVRDKNGLYQSCSV